MPGVTKLGSIRTSASLGTRLSPFSYLFTVTSASTVARNACLVIESPPFSMTLLSSRYCRELNSHPDTALQCDLHVAWASVSREHYEIQQLCKFGQRWDTLHMPNAWPNVAHAGSHTSSILTTFRSAGGSLELSVHTWQRSTTVTMFFNIASSTVWNDAALGAVLI